MKLDTALSRNLLTWSEMARDYIQLGHQLREKLFPGSHQNYVLILFPQRTIAWAKVYIFAVNNHFFCSSWLWTSRVSISPLAWWHLNTEREEILLVSEILQHLACMKTHHTGIRPLLTGGLSEASTVIISVSISWETKKIKALNLYLFLLVFAWRFPIFGPGSKKKHASQRGHGLRYWWNFRRSWKGDEGGGPVGSICR